MENMQLNQLKKFIKAYKEKLLLLWNCWPAHSRYLSFCSIALHSFWQIMVSTFCSFVLCPCLCMWHRFFPSQFGFHCIAPTLMLCVYAKRSPFHRIFAILGFFSSIFSKFISIVFCRHRRCNRECVQAIELCLILQLRKLNGEIGLKAKCERNAMVETKKRTKRDGQKRKCNCFSNTSISLSLGCFCLWVFELLPLCVWRRFLPPVLLPTRDFHLTFPCPFSRFFVQHLTISALCFL